MEMTDKNNIEKSIDLLATRIAEVRLSELGFRFIPGIYPVFQRIRQYLEARALIIKSKGGII